MAQPRPDLSLLSMPYRATQPLTTASLRSLGPEDGRSLVWRIDHPISSDLLSAVIERPRCLALQVMLPKADDIDVNQVLDVMERCRPSTILPFHPMSEIEEWTELLRRTPSHLGVDVTEFMRWRGLRLSWQTTILIRKLIDLSQNHRTISGVARRLYMSRRALGRRFQTRRLPPPSRWLQFGRLLRVSCMLQSGQRTAAEAARAIGYPDGFSMSNQMVRLLGVRPTYVRDRYGWEWIANRWITREFMSKSSSTLPFAGDQPITVTTGDGS